MNQDIMVMSKNICKYNAFTFVELLMVMLILGIIITLTMPLLQNIKNDDELYRSYMKKAIHDVTDATSLVFLREKYLTDFTANSLPPGSFFSGGKENSRDGEEEKQDQCDG